MRGLQKHIISIIIAAVALIVGENKTDLIELDDSLNLPSTTEIAYYCDNQELEQELPSQLISCATYRTTTLTKRVNNTHKKNYEISCSKKISNSYFDKYILKKPKSFYAPFSDANLMLISFGKLII